MHVHKSEDNTKSELGEMSCDHVDWVQMRQDMVLGSKQTRNFLTSWATFSFPKRNLLHRLCYKLSLAVTCVPVTHWFGRRKFLTLLLFSSITSSEISFWCFDSSPLTMISTDNHSNHLFLCSITLGGDGSVAEWSRHEFWKFLLARLMTFTGKVRRWSRHRSTGTSWLTDTSI
jgi:hypothetical protein